jgi:DNA-binding GntR family transcriptional regulator
MVKTADKIREALEQAIIEGEFADGERLDEVSISRRFSVSRTPVREALLALTASGLVEQLPRRGVFVRYPSFVNLIEMFEVMAELEAMCGRLAARQAGESNLTRLHEALDRCDDACAEGDTDRYYRDNELFHLLLYEASGNSFLAAEAVRLQRRLKPFRRLQLRVRNRMKQSMAEHRAVVAAVEAGDADAAGELLRRHVAIQGEKFTDLMSTYKNRAAEEQPNASRKILQNTV